MFPKPAKGSAWTERRDRRKAVEASEDAEKQTVRLRDRVCRWPQCGYCRSYKPRLEVAHIKAKGQGGDHGVRSTADQMILLCFLSHQGSDGLERHERDVRPLTSAGTNGPCEFWQRDALGTWYLVARERAPFVYERD